MSEERTESDSVQEQRKLRTAGRMLAQRDLAVLSWIAEQYAVRFDQLRRLLARGPMPGSERPPGAAAELTPGAVYRALARWRQNGEEVVEYRRIFHAQPGWCWLTPAGLRLLRMPYTRLTPAPSTLPHLYQINRVRLDIERRHPEYHWVSERSLRMHLPRRAGGEAIVHTPDAQVWVPGRRGAGEKAVAVEVELSAKSERELDGILTELLMPRAAGPSGFFMYATVWYFVTPATRRVVEEARARLATPARSRVAVIALDALPA